MIFSIVEIIPFFKIGKLRQGGPQISRQFIYKDLNLNLGRAIGIATAAFA
jgi:hypothetical protein